MLELPSTLYYASIFRVEKNENAGKLYETVMQFLFEYVTEWIPSLPYTNFLSHGNFVSDDQSVKASIASISGQTDTSPSSSVRWAVSLRMTDPTIKRRRWTIHIGVAQAQDTEEYVVSYLETYNDHHAGMLSPFPAPQTRTPFFIHRILQTKSFNCTVGFYQVPAEPVVLDFETLNSFLDLIFDQTRHIPIVVITCPDIIDLRELVRATLGNTVVYFARDPGVVFAANEYLPVDHPIPLGSIQIYPTYQEGKLTHFTYSPNVVTRHSASIMASIRRAYCESVPSSKRREYITADDIMQQRNQTRTTQYEARIKALEATVSQFENQKHELCTLVESLKSELTASTALLDRDLVKEIEQYEAVIAESMTEMETAKRQLTEIAGAMFHEDQGKPMLAEPPVWSQIAHICEAARHRGAILALKHKKSVHPT